MPLGTLFQSRKQKEELKKQEVKKILDHAFSDDFGDELDDEVYLEAVEHDKVMQDEETDGVLIPAPTESVPRDPILAATTVQPQQPIVIPVQELPKNLPEQLPEAVSVVSSPAPALAEPVAVSAFVPLEPSVPASSSEISSQPQNGFELIAASETSKQDAQILPVEDQQPATDSSQEKSVQQQSEPALPSQSAFNSERRDSSVARSHCSHFGANNPDKSDEYYPLADYLGQITYDPDCDPERTLSL